MLWQCAARFRGQLRQKNIERANAAFAKLFGKGLDADADERRQLARVHSGAHFIGRGRGVPVLFVIGTVAVSVFEVEPEVLHRFPPEFFPHAAIDCVREPCRAVFAPHCLRIGLDGFRNGGDRVWRSWQAIRSWQANRFCEDCEIGRVFVERSQREISQPARGSGAEKMRSAVYHVNRLAFSGGPRIAPLKRFVGLLQPHGDFVKRFRRQCSLHLRLVQSWRFSDKLSAIAFRMCDSGLSESTGQDTFVCRGGKVPS